MKKFSIGNRLTLYLLAACAVLGGVLKMQSQNIIETKENASPKAQAAMDPLSRKSFTAPSVATFSEVTERPLFLSGRQPPPKPQPKPRAPVRVMPLRLQLDGVVISPTEKTAVMLDLSNNETLHMTVGMQHQGWELSAIGKTTATFKLGGQTQELEMIQ